MNLVFIRNILLLLAVVSFVFGLLIYSINLEIALQRKNAIIQANEQVILKSEQAKKDSLQALLIQEQIKFYKKQNKK